MKQLIAVILTVFTCQVVSSDITWTFPPETLSTNAVNASNPELAMDSVGNLVAVWLENGVVKAKAKPYNMSWGTISTLSGSGASSPKVVSDPNGNAAAVWIEGTVIKAATRPLNGSWSAVSTLSGTSATTPHVAASPAGDFIAAWARSGDTQSSTKLSGGNWGTAQTINSTGATAPHVAIGGTGSQTRAYVVWQGTASSVNVVYGSTKLISGTWATQQALSSTSHQASGAHVAVDANANALAVWYQYDVNGSQYSNVVVQSSGRSASGTWNPAQDLSTAGMRNPTTLIARVAFDGQGNGIALWNNSSNDATFSIQSAMKPVQGVWTDPKEVVSLNTYALDADMAVSSLGEALAVYMFYNGTNVFIQSSELDMLSFMQNLWSVPVNVSQGTNNAYPRVAAALTGNVINAAAVWLSNTGVSNAVLATTGARTTVLPPSSVTVTQSSHNFGVLTEYFNTVSWQASTDPNVVGYLVFRNGTPIGQVNASVVQYIDNNRVQSGAVTYGVSAIDKDQSRSRIITASYP